MKITVEISDQLHRRAKATAAPGRCRFSDVVEDRLRHVLVEPREKSGRRLADLMKDALGIVDSGVTDLASNPAHLADLGRRHGGHL